MPPGPAAAATRILTDSDNVEFDTNAMQDCPGKGEADGDFFLIVLFCFAN